MLRRIEWRRLIEGNTEPEPLPSTLQPDASQAPELALVASNSYGQILKSSALIGGSSMLGLAIGVVRTKVMALLLGPSGFGLLALYSSIIDVTVTSAGMGVSSSGVRQIAEAVGSGRTDRIARTVAVLRRTSIILGVLGAVFLGVFAGQVSTLTFGSSEQAASVALLSLAVFFRVVSAGEGALIQGMRRISDLAKMGILSALAGTIIGVVLVYFLGEEGLAPSLVAVAFVGLTVSWWYARKVRTDRPTMTRPEARHEAASLLKLGFAFMASGILMMGAAYAARTMVLRMVSFDAAGLYQAAWALGGLYVGIIFQAMGADFYPRLTGIAKDNVQSNRLVNEQTQVSLLLAGPGVVATMTFAPLAILLLYSAEFDGATEILRWICLGVSLRVITWPMGFIIVAKGQQTIFLLTELAWTIVNVLLTWLCVSSFGVNGAGIAFFGSYVFHAIMIYPIVRRISGFRWSAANRKGGLLFLFSISAVFCAFYFLSPPLAIGFGILATIMSGVYSTRRLVNLVSRDRIPSRVRSFLIRLHLLPPPSDGNPQG